MMRKAQRSLGGFPLSGFKSCLNLFDQSCVTYPGWCECMSKPYLFFRSVVIVLSVFATQMDK